MALAQGNDYARDSVSDHDVHRLNAAQSLTTDHHVVTPYSMEFEYPKSRSPAASPEHTPVHTPISLQPRKNDSDPSPVSVGLSRAKTDARVKVNDRKKKRKSRRSKKDEKKWKKKMKEIGKNHPEFELSYDLLLGIRTSTSTVNQSIIRSSIALQEDDSSEDEEFSH